MDCNELLWFDKFIFAIQDSNCSKLDLRSWGLPEYAFPLNGDKERWEAIQILLTRIKREKPDQIDEITRGMERQLRPDYRRAESFFPLTANAIREMIGSGLIEFGSHGECHEIWTRMGVTQAIESIEASICGLQKVTSNQVRCIAYPNGEYSPGIVAEVKKKSISFAFTTNRQLWRPSADNHEIPRIAVGGYDSLFRFAANISGLTGRGKPGNGEMTH
jgi:hypothetical protein